MTSTESQSRETPSAEVQPVSVTDVLRSDILTGRFEPGDRLLEVNLAEDYTCGRAAIRSALVALTSEGLVEREANRGATVRRISLREAIQITQARSALESPIAAEAARHTTADDHLELQQIINDMRSAVADERGRDYSTLNGVLHRRLREMSGHETAAELVANLRNRARTINIDWLSCQAGPTTPSCNMPPSSTP